jgi:hypothetical protein
MLTILLNMGILFVIFFLFWAAFSAWKLVAMGLGYVWLTILEKLNSRKAKRR